MTGIRHGELTFAVLCAERGTRLDVVSLFRSILLRGIDFREARARVRIAEVLALMGLPTAADRGQANAWTVPAAPLPLTDQSGVRGAWAPERVSLFCLWGGWQRLGLMGSVDRAESVRRRCRPVPASGPGHPVAARVPRPINQEANHA